jgi:hypothetical protein
MTKKVYCPAYRSGTPHLLAGDQKGTSQEVRQAQILSKADANGPGWPNKRLDKQM